MSSTWVPSEQIMFQLQTVLLNLAAKAASDEKSLIVIILDMTMSFGCVYLPKLLMKLRGYSTFTPRWFISLHI